MCAGALAAGRRAKESVVKGKNVSPIPAARVRVLSLVCSTEGGAACQTVAGQACARILPPDQVAFPKSLQNGIAACCPMDYITIS